MGSSQYNVRQVLESLKSKAKKRGAKTFRTEEKAHDYAKANKIVKYEIYRLSNHKFRIDKN